MFVKKWPLEYQKVIKTYLSTYLWDSSDISDSFDGSDSNDTSDRSGSKDRSEDSDQTSFFHQKTFLTIFFLIFFLPRNFVHQKNLKLKWWWNS